MNEDSRVELVQDDGRSSLEVSTPHDLEGRLNHKEGTSARSLTSLHDGNDGGRNPRKLVRHRSQKRSQQDLHKYLKNSTKRGVKRRQSSINLPELAGAFQRKESNIKFIKRQQKLPKDGDRLVVKKQSTRKSLKTLLVDPVCLSLSPRGKK